MKPVFYGHPFSSYCQKVLIALYERGIDFDLRNVDRANPGIAEEMTGLWPLGHMPVLVDAGRTLPESTIIIEHLDLHHAGADRLIPQDPVQALDVRLMDRLFDNYVMTPMQRIVFDHVRPAAARDHYGVEKARGLLDKAYAWLDARIAAGPWAAGPHFTLADCAAAPALFYADWVHEIPPHLPHLSAYRARLLAHPSVARAVDGGRPYRHYFPPGAPDRD